MLTHRAVGNSLTGHPSHTRCDFRNVIYIVLDFVSCTFVRVTDLAPDPPTCESLLLILDWPVNETSSGNQSKESHPLVSCMMSSLPLLCVSQLSMGVSHN